jgi:hypothetical protein
VKPDSKKKHTSTDVEPVRVVGSQLLEGASLDKVDPAGNFQTTGSLQVGSVGLDERLSVDVFDGCSWHIAGLKQEMEREKKFERLEYKTQIDPANDKKKKKKKKSPSKLKSQQRLSEDEGWTPEQHSCYIHEDIETFRLKNALDQL